MKFDLNKAWSDATDILKANMNVVGIVAAVFFFLPSLALGVLAPGSELEAAAGNPDQLRAAFSAYFLGNWWLFLLYFLMTVIGTLAVFALFGKNPKPTVGESINSAIRGLLPYLGATLLVAVAVGILATLVGALVALTGIAILGVVFAIALAAFFVVVSIRLILVGPIIAIDGVANPITALQQSWNLVKGNTRRVFLFLFLLFVALFVVSMVLGLLFAGVGAMLGATGALWVEAILGGILGAAMTVLMLAVYTAIYRQLAGNLSQSDLDTFE